MQKMLRWEETGAFCRDAEEVKKEKCFSLRGIVSNRKIVFFLAKDRQDLFKLESQNEKRT